MENLKETKMHTSFFEENKVSINESLVSLRFVRKIEDVLTQINVTNRELAHKLGYSESYISQLMTGTKKINVSFINRFETVYNLELEINIIKRKTFKNSCSIGIKEGLSSSYMKHSSSNDANFILSINSNIATIFNFEEGCINNVSSSKTYYSFETIE